MSTAERESLTRLLREVDQTFPEGTPDYRGREITRAHVGRYLRTSWHRTVEMCDVLGPHIAGRRLLDIGVGYGFLDILLKEQGADVTGLELPENISAYCRLLQRHQIPVLPGILGDSRAVVADASFDVVVLAEVLEHLRLSPLRALHDTRRMLRPGGLLLLTTPNIARVANIIRLSAGHNILEPLPDDDTGLDHITDRIQHIREYTLSELVNLTKRAGYHILSARHSAAADRPPPGESGSWLKRGLWWGMRATVSLVPGWRGLLFVLAQKPAGST